MKVRVKVKSDFYHGNKPFAAGDTGEFTKAEASDMEKSGLVEITGEVADDSQAKMDTAVENKMANATRNKSEKK